jgi:hypothetical protein
MRLWIPAFEAVIKFNEQRLEDAQRRSSAFLDFFTRSFAGMTTKEGL